MKKIILLNRTKFFTCWVLLLAAFSSTAQEAKQEIITWNANRKIALTDFKLRAGGNNEAASYASFFIEYRAGAKELLSNNLNKRVSTNFLTSESWIDTTQDVRQALRFQQSSFDLCEIYVRQFRKALYDNRKKIKSLKFIDQLNEHYTNAFSKRRMEYDLDTKAATDEAAQQKWETIIEKELNELDSFSLEKSN
jgi:hypothetical protein